MNCTGCSTDLTFFAVSCRHLRKADSVASTMNENEAPVIVEHGYEDVVAFLREFRSETFGVVLGQMRHMGADIGGDLNIYWPADSFVIAFGLSVQEAEVGRRLLSDPRIEVVPRVPGAVADIDESRRSWKNLGAHPSRVRSLKPYVNDRPVYGVHLKSLEESLDPRKFEQGEPNALHVWRG